MRSGCSVVSSTVAAARNGHIGSCTRGGLRSSAVAMRSTISFVVMTSRPAMMNVSPTAAGCSRREQQAAHQVVDVDALPPVRAGADHEELPALDRAEQLQQPPVARPVGFGDAHDRSVEVVRARAHQRFGLQFRLLVGIFRTHCALLVELLLARVAVHAHRAAVDEAADRGAATFLQQLRTTSTLTERKYAAGMCDSCWAAAK